jgi:hypothetical protein
VYGDGCPPFWSGTLHVDASGQTEGKDGSQTMLVVAHVEAGSHFMPEL